MQHTLFVSTSSRPKRSLTASPSDGDIQRRGDRPLLPTVVGESRTTHASRVRVAEEGAAPVVPPTTLFFFELVDLLFACFGDDDNGDALLPASLVLFVAF